MGSRVIKVRLRLAALLGALGATMSLVPAARAQSVSDSSVVQDFVMAAIFSDQPTMLAQLSPTAQLAISDGHLMDNGRLDQKAVQIDAVALGKLFSGCQFEMLIGSFAGVHIDFCAEKGSTRHRLAQFRVKGGKVVSVTISRGWAHAPAIVRPPAAN